MVDLNAFCQLKRLGDVTHNTDKRNDREAIFFTIFFIIVYMVCCN